MNFNSTSINIIRKFIETISVNFNIKSNINYIFGNIETIFINNMLYIIIPIFINLSYKSFNYSNKYSNNLTTNNNFNYMILDSEYYCNYSISNIISSYYSKTKSNEISSIYKIYYSNVYKSYVSYIVYSIINYISIFFSYYNFSIIIYNIYNPIFSSVILYKYIYNIHTHYT